MKKFRELKDKKDEKFKNVNYLKLKEFTWNKDINKDKVEQYLKKLDEPFVIRNYYNAAAVKNWNEDTIADIFGDLILPIEVYTSELSYYNANKSDIVKELTVRDYMEHMKNVEKPPYYYLAEVDLYEKMNDPAMSTYILNDTYNENEDKNDHQVESLYMGYYTSSGCHIHIEEDYVLNQVVGTKEVIMFDYHANEEHLTRKSLFDTAGNFIKDDFFELDHNKLNSLYKVILNPGDSLFIPPWWYHTVRGSKFSCSITRIHHRNNWEYTYKPSIKLTLILLYLQAYFFSEWNFQAIFKEYSFCILIFIITLVLFYSLFYKKQLFTIYNG